MKKVPLKELATITAGQSAPKPEMFSNEGLPFVRAGSLEELIAGKKESDLELISIDVAESLRLRLYPAGSILFAKSGMSATKNRFYQLKTPAYVVSHLAILIPKDCLFVDYIRHVLIKYPPSSLIKDLAYPAICLGDIQDFKVPVPEDSDDQIRIATLLSKVENLISRRREQLRQLDELLKSVFLEMFGDPISNPKRFPVKLLSEFYIKPKNGTKCGPFGSALKKNELVESGIPVWNMDNISPSGRMILPFRMWVTEEKFQELRSYSVIDGDIIISRAGTVGKMCVAKMDCVPAIISTNLIRVRLGSLLLPRHIISLMTYCRGRVGRLKTGADGTFTHMNTGILDKLEFPYPPLELQRKFAEIFEKVESIKIQYQRSLFKMEHLYGTISQKAFKGALDLSRVPVVEEGEPVI
jgi:type I restriction enzyme S subunit